MITHQTLYSLANTLGVMAMMCAVGYHFVAVAEKQVGGGAKKGQGR